MASEILRIHKVSIFLLTLFILFSRLRFESFITWIKKHKWLLFIFYHLCWYIYIKLDQKYATTLMIIFHGKQWLSGNCYTPYSLILGGRSTHDYKMKKRCVCASAINDSNGLTSITSYSCVSAQCSSKQTRTSPN